MPRIFEEELTGLRLLRAASKTTPKSSRTLLLPAGAQHSPWLLCLEQEQPQGGESRT